MNTLLAPALAYRQREIPSAWSVDDGTNALDHGNLQIGRWRPEIELDAALADSPRASFRVLHEAGIGIDDFVNPDSLAIYLALEQASPPWGKPWTTENIALECKRLMMAVDAWHDDDDRPFVAGTGQWTAPGLIAVLCRVKFDAGLIRQKADELRGIDGRQLELIARMTKGVAA